MWVMLLLLKKIRMGGFVDRTNNDGLIHWKINTGEPQLFVREVSDANSLSSDAVSCLLRTRDGKLWIGTLGGGLDCYDNGRFTHYKNMVKK